MEKQLGIVMIQYNRNSGNLYTTFTPTTHTTLRDQKPIKTGDEITIRGEVQKAVSKWFDDMNEVELADREKHEIVTEEVYCKHYDTGELKEAEYKVLFKSINQETTKQNG